MEELSEAELDSIRARYVAPVDPDVERDHSASGRSARQGAESRSTAP